MIKSIYPHPTWIEIDLAQFKKNLAIVRRNIGNSLFCLPIKGNAYGHGLSQMGKAAEEVGVDYLGVSCLQEGVKLRQAGIRIPILILGAIHEDQVEDLIHFGLEFSISSKYKAEIVAKNCEPAKKKCRVHIEVDTGMQRTGVRCATALDLFQYLKSKECFEVVGIYSHLATADQPSDPVAERQINQFHELLGHPLLGEHRWIVHMANSNGVIHFPQAHLGMVRPGILAFGYVPPNADERWRGIAPCFSLKSKVSYFKVVEKGEGISYGHTYRTAEKTRVVTVPIGYGDGYRRGLSNKGSVLIRGKKFLISGAICMDQFMVDVGSEEVYVGDEVVLIGRQGDAEISLLEISQLCETVPHEVLCLLNDRIPRFYK